MTFKTNATIAAIALGAVLSLNAGAALASQGEGINEATRAQITEKLRAEGYEVRKIEMEDGMIEVYALKNGVRYELYLDKDMNVSRSKTDD